MFRTHKIGSNSLSIKNLVLLFLTIVFGFGSVITLAQITIPTSIENAWQTIGRVTITTDGTDNGEVLMDINASGARIINPSLLNLQSTFNGMVFGIDDNGQIISVPSTGLVVVLTGAVEDDDWVITGNNIYRLTGSVSIGNYNPIDIFDVNGKFTLSDTAPYAAFNTVGRTAGSNDLAFVVKANNTTVFAVNKYGQLGLRGIDENSAFSLQRDDGIQYALIATNNDNGYLELTKKIDQAIPHDVYITTSGTSYLNGGNVDIGVSSPTFTMDGKLNVTSSGQKELFLQETNPGNAANINFKNTVNTRLMGGYSDYFYIGMSGIPFLNITTGGYVGIGTSIPTYLLDVDGAGNFKEICLSGDCISAWPISGLGDSLWTGIGVMVASGYGYGITGMLITPIETEEVRLQLGYGGHANGFASIALGEAATADGIRSTAIGPGAYAVGASSVAFGESNQAIGDYSTAFGYHTQAIGRVSTAFGIDTQAIGTGSTAIGISNVGITGAIFEIGIGTLGSPSNALTILNNGYIGIGTTTPTQVLEVNGNILGQSIQLTKDNAGDLCSGGNIGQIILSGTNFFGCNGSIWKQLDN